MERDRVLMARAPGTSLASPIGCAGERFLEQRRRCADLASSWIAARDLADAERALLCALGDLTC